MKKQYYVTPRYNVYHWKTVVLIGQDYETNYMLSFGIRSFLLHYFMKCKENAQSCDIYRTYIST